MLAKSNDRAIRANRETEGIFFDIKNISKKVKKPAAQGFKKFSLKG